MEIVGLQNKSEHQQHLQQLLNTTEFMQLASLKKKLFCVLSLLIFSN